MKILIARLNHETNTFSPVPTPLEAFSPTYGEDAPLVKCTRHPHCAGSRHRAATRPLLRAPNRFFRETASSLRIAQRISLR